MADQELSKLNHLKSRNRQDEVDIRAKIRSREAEFANLASGLLVNENTFAQGWQIITDTLLARAELQETISDPPPLPFTDIQQAEIAGWKSIYLPKVLANPVYPNERMALAHVGGTSRDGSLVLAINGLRTDTPQTGWYMQKVEPIQVGEDTTLESVKARLKKGDISGSTLPADIYARAVEKLLGFERDRKVKVLCPGTVSIRGAYNWTLTTLYDETTGKTMILPDIRLGSLDNLSLRYMIPMDEWHKGIPDVMEFSDFST